MSSSIRLVVFDLDGTLVHFHHDYLLDETLRILPLLEHPPVDRMELIDHFSSFDFFRFVAGENKEQFVESFWSHFNWDSFPKAVPFASTLTILQTLRQAGFELAIATARLMPALTLRQELAHSGLLDHIPHLVSREDDATDWKDKTGHLRKLCADLDIPPHQSAMIGDIPTDVLSAKEVGFGMTIAVTTGGIRREVLETAEPDYILDDLSILPEILAR